MSKKKPIVKTCAKCNKPFSTTDDGIVLCRACMNDELKAAAEAERARQDQVAETKTCPGCNSEFTITVGEKEFLESRGLSAPKFCKKCRELLKKHRAEIQKERTCTDCGKSFKLSAITVLKNLRNGSDLPTTCQDCGRKAIQAAEAARQRREALKVYKTVTCKDCGKEFDVTVGEHEFLVSHGMTNDPVRCPDCRRKRKVKAMVDDMRAGVGNSIEEELAGMEAADPSPETTAEAEVMPVETVGEIDMSVAEAEPPEAETSEEDGDTGSDPAFIEAAAPAAPTDELPDLDAPAEKDADDVEEAILVTPDSPPAVVWEGAEGTELVGEADAPAPDAHSDGKSAAACAEAGNPDSKAWTKEEDKTVTEYYAPGDPALDIAEDSDKSAAFASLDTSDPGQTAEIPDGQNTDDTPAAEPEMKTGIDVDETADKLRKMYPQDGRDTAEIDAQVVGGGKPGLLGKLFGGKRDA